MELQTLPQKKSVETIQEWLVSKLVEQFNIDHDSLDINIPLTKYGLDSIVAFTVVGELEEWLEVELPATLLWDYPTITEIAEYIAKLEIV